MVKAKEAGSSYIYLRDQVEANDEYYYPLIDPVLDHDDNVIADGLGVIVKHTDELERYLFGLVRYSDKKPTSFFHLGGLHEIKKYIWKHLGSLVAFSQVLDNSSYRSKGIFVLPDRHNIEVWHKGKMVYRSI